MPLFRPCPGHVYEVSIGRVMKGSPREIDVHWPLMLLLIQETGEFGSEHLTSPKGNAEEDHLAGTNTQARPTASKSSHFTPIIVRYFCF